MNLRDVKRLLGMATPERVAGVTPERVAELHAATDAAFDAVVWEYRAAWCALPEPRPDFRAWLDERKTFVLWDVVIRTERGE